MKKGVHEQVKTLIMSKIIEIIIYYNEKDEDFQDNVQDTGAYPSVLRGDALRRKKTARCFRAVLII